MRPLHRAAAGGLPLLWLALAPGCSEGRSVAPAPEEVSLAVITRGAGCPALDPARVSFRCGPDPIDAPIPRLVDPEGAALEPFYERLAGLARGRAKDHVRMAMYGDSNLTTDETTGRLRRQLQGRFGDAGHGFVALAKPWKWYVHTDVAHDGTWRAFRQIATSTARVEDGHYGFANVAAESPSPGALAFVSTAPADPRSPIGWRAEHFDVFYMKRPTGGRFEIQLDGAVVREIDTRSPRVEAGFERVDAPDGKHELRVRILGHGMVRLYGVAIERGDPSVVVDALGTGALNMQQMATVQPDTRRAQLARRAHDLVILHLGTNMLGTKAELVEETRAVIGELRAALPGAAILILSPPDTFEEGTERDGHANAMAPLLARIAAENGVAYWDFHAAMGGAGSIRTFVKKGLAWGDHIHLTKPGHERMADRMLCAVSDGMAAYLERNPRAGCGDR